MNDIKGIIEDVEKSSLVSDKVIKKVIEIIGQEEWNDIHNEESDICTTTGELVITLKNITSLEKENAELKGEANSVLDNWCRGDDPCPHLKERDDNLIKAKELIENIIRVTWGGGWNYSLDWKVKAEQFLNSEVEK